jgi:alkyl hydroperoxide reductase subunit AhpC
MINWRIYLLGGLLAAMFGLSMYIAHLQTEMIKAKKEAETARGQVTVSEGTAQAIDRLVIQERNITHEVQNVVREIDALPTGEALVPDDVAAAWANGLDGLRDDATQPNGDSAGKP